MTARDPQPQHVDPRKLREGERIKHEGVWGTVKRISHKPTETLALVEFDEDRGDGRFAIMDLTDAKIVVQH